MKNRLLIVITAILMALHVTTKTCPTCIGKLERTTPPFFSPEYDKHCAQCTHEHAPADHKKPVTQPVPGKEK